MPFHLGNDRARLAPDFGLITEIGMMLLDCVRWTSRPAPEKMRNMAFQDLVASQPDGIAEFVGFEIIKQIRHSEGGIGAQTLARAARPPVALNVGIKHCPSIMGAVNVAGAKRTRLKIAVLLEDKERVMSGAAEMPVPGRAFLRSMNRALGTVDIWNQIG